MKAWLVREDYEGRSAVVFAETQGKAKSIAIALEDFDGYGFCDIYARRCPHMDKYYSDGKRYMDWFYSKDRIALVRDCGFRCDPDCFDPDDCEVCPAKEYCDVYQDYKEELKDEEEAK